MRPREKATVRQRLLAVLSAAAVVAAVAGFAGSPAAGAQPGLFSGESICAALFGFAAEPVPVVKSADGETVLASVEWGYNADHNLCYLVLDAAAVQTLRANPPTPTALPPTDTDRSAAARCHNAYNPDRGFASEPVPVVKSADGQTVLASVKWGYNADHTLCYLILDDAAQQTLLTHHPCATNPNSPECTSSQPIPEPSDQSARQALVALYNATDGPNWTNNTNWNTDEPLSTWHGITTDASGKVTIVDLRDNGLTGTIPPQLGNLTSLQILDLRTNGLTGTIPQEIGNLTSLDWLELSFNRLTGTIPPELANLTQLTTLALSNNALTGTIPPQLANLTGLTGIYLWANNLHGPIPLSFTALTELEHFYTPANNAICLPNNLHTWHNNIENKTPLPNCDNTETAEPPPCASPEPSGEYGVGIGADGLPCATRVLTAEMLSAPPIDGYMVYSYHIPAIVPDHEALGHITACLRSAADGGDPFPDHATGWGEPPEGATAMHLCSWVWHRASNPIAYAGMRPEAKCVYEVMVDFHLFAKYRIWEVYTEDSRPPSAYYGWAELCPVWFDRDWTMTFWDKCRALYAHYVGADEAARRIDRCGNQWDPEYWEDLFQPHGACRHRYELARGAVLIFQGEARELGRVGDGTVDFMLKFPDDAHRFQC